MKPTTFYKHMKDFVLADASRPVFQHIWFDGEYGIATNTHALCAVKYKAEPHFETADGTKAELSAQYPDWKKVVLKEDRDKAKITLQGKTMEHLSDWIRLLKFVLQVTKEKGVKAAYQIYVICLDRRGTDLFLYFIMTGCQAPVKVKMMSDLPDDGEHFKVFVNARYILAALSFIKDTEAESVDWVFEKKSPLMQEYTKSLLGRMELRTEELRVTITSCKINDTNSELMRKLVDFIETDDLQAADEKTDDLGFLD